MKTTAIQTTRLEPARARSAVIRRSILAAFAVILVLMLLWARGLPLFVGWQVARDHARCYGRARLPARLWSNEPREVGDWLESRGTPVQPLPARVGDLSLIGVRYCALADRIAAHVYYGARRDGVSVFVLSGPARIRGGWQGRFGSVRVRLMRSAGRTLAIVGVSQEDVDAMTRVFRSSEA